MDIDYSTEVQKILVLGGNKTFAKIIEQQKFNKLNSSEMIYLVGHNFLGNKVSKNQKYTQKIEMLLNNPKLKFFSMLLVMYFYGRNLKKAKYFKTRANFLLFSRYRVVNLQSLKEVMRHTITSKTLLLFFILGFFRFPRKILVSLLGQFCREKYIFTEILGDLKPNTVLLLDNGDSPIFFLLNVINKSPCKYGLLIYSWDNPTTKLFPSDIFDFIGTWNFNQIEELDRISNFPPNRTEVIGSELSDKIRKSRLERSYSKSKSAMNSRKLLITGMASKSDEVIEVLKIAKMVSSGACYYKTLVYRPHPRCSYTLKFVEKLKKEFLDFGVEINLMNDFNVADYSSVICYPSTLLLEVIGAKNFAVFYTPRYRRWKVDPFKISKADYFDKVKELDAINCISDYENLRTSLKHRLPEIKDYSSSTFDKILPNLKSTYLERIDLLVKSNLK